MTTQKNSNKKIIGMILALVALIILFAMLFVTFRAKPVDGTKNITIEVVDNTATSILYEITTTADFLQEAIEETEGLEVTGTDGEFGLMVDTVNGIRADFTLDGAYWSFNVNGDYCNYGISEQPILDGDKFQIIYTPAE